MSSVKSTKDEVREAIKNFTEALNIPGDAVRFKNAFHPNARIYHGSLGADRSIPSDDYCERAASAPEEEWEAIETVLLDITGDAAFAIVEWRHPAGRRPQNNPNDTFTDYYPLLKVDNAWKVTSLTDELKREGIIPDKDGIQKTLQTFYGGFDSHDYDLMKTAFHMDVRVYGDDDDFRKGLGFDDWRDTLSRRSPETFEREVLLSIIGETIAFAKVKWRGSVHSFTDYYTLTFVNSSWIITTRIFSTKNH